MKAGKLAALAVVVIVAILAWRWYQGKYGVAKNFSEAQIQEWAQMNGAKGEGSVGENESPYRIGKSIVLRSAAGTPVGMSYIPGFIDSVWYGLPSKIRAVKPAEVGTVILVEKGANVSSTSSAVGENLRMIRTFKSNAVHLRVFDAARKVLIGDAFVDADLGKDYETAVIDFIRAMPER